MEHRGSRTVSYLPRDDRVRLRVHDALCAHAPLEQRVLEPAIGKVAAPFGRAPAVVAGDNQQSIVHHTDVIKLVDYLLYLEPREQITRIRRDSRQCCAVWCGVVHDLYW